MLQHVLALTVGHLQWAFFSKWSLCFNLHVEQAAHYIKKSLKMANSYSQNMLEHLLINKSFVQQIGIKFYICNAQNMYNIIKNNTVF